MGYGKIISANDENMDSPKIRKDQQRKIQNIVRSNDPDAALILVREASKNFEGLKSVDFDLKKEAIVVSVHSHFKGLTTNYTFRLSAPTLISSPSI